MCTVIHYVAALYFHLHLVFIHFTKKIGYFDYVYSLINAYRTQQLT